MCLGAESECGTRWTDFIIIPLSFLEINHGMGKETTMTATGTSTYARGIEIFAMVLIHVIDCPVIVTLGCLES